jgi:hypothetical protein
VWPKGFNNKKGILSYGVTKYKNALGIVLFRPMTCLRHVRLTPIDFTLGFCIK